MQKLTPAVLLLFIFLSGCHNSENPQPEFEQVFLKVDVNSDPNLNQIVNEFKQASQDIGKESNSNEYITQFGTLRLDKIIKRISSKSQKNPNYSIRLISPEGTSGTIEYLVLNATEDGYKGHILQYEPDHLDDSGENVLENYSGYIRILDYNRKIHSEELFKEGVQIESATNGKIYQYANCNCKYESRPVYGPVLNDIIGYDLWIVCVCENGGGSSSDVSSSDGFGDFGMPTGDTNDGNTDGSTTGGGGSSGGSGSTSKDPQPIGLSPLVTDEEIMVMDLLELDPFALIEVDCDQIQHWKNLAQHVPPSEIINKLNGLDENSFGDFNVQNVEDAAGVVVNMDYFPVTINTLPKKPGSNERFTPNEFLNHVRKNINNFINTNYSSFTPSTVTGINESAIWLSNNPVGAVLHINIPNGPGDGSVICSKYSSNQWIFTTIEVPYNLFMQGFDGEHPVSGNREFGLITNPNGTYTFYTRGVDRITNGIDAFVADNVLKDAFANPDALWNSLKNKVHNYVQNNGGSSVTPKDSDNIINRPDWDEIKDVFSGKLPITDLGCN